jgi:threonine synthase
MFVGSEVFRVAAFLGYLCSICGSDYGADFSGYVCPKDSGNLDIRLDLDGIRGRVDPAGFSSIGEESLWRYLPLLPVGDPGHEGTALRAAGWTPLLKPARLGLELGMPDLWLKDDGRTPTASFKDRASAVAVARAHEIGAETIVTASTGNAGAALAGMAAAAGLPAVILAPRTAPPAKVAQLLIFGARVILVDGSYDQAFDLTIEASRHFGWYCRNTGYNPFTIEGKKTAAFEICEQLTRVSPSRGTPNWSSPDAVFVSVGDGNIISGLHKGFRELHDLGWTDKVPRLFGVQAEGSAAVAQAFEAGGEAIVPVRASTLADSISVDLPRDGVRAVRAARATGGGYVVVSDDDILAAIRTLGAQAAVFTEPAAAASFAGLVAALDRGWIDREAQVVVVLTGSGLKDVGAAMKAAGEASVIEPTLDALRRLVPEGGRP